MTSKLAFLKKERNALQFSGLTTDAPHFYSTYSAQLMIDITKLTYGVRDRGGSASAQLCLYDCRYFAQTSLLALTAPVTRWIPTAS